MKKIEILKINLILMMALSIIGYGALAIIGWLMSLNIPVPILIIGFCILLYITIRKEVI